jgi:hypothetical protein
VNSNHRRKGEQGVLKKKKGTLRKRGGALLLTLALFATMFPASVYADETGTSNITAQDVIAAEMQGGYGDEGEITVGNEAESVGGENGNTTGETVGNESTNEEETTPGEETAVSWTDALSMQEVMVMTYGAIDHLALFQAYVEEMMQGTSGFDSSTLPGNASEGAQLSGVSKNAYQLLRNQISLIAKGSSTSTTVTISAQELGIQGGWTLADLNIENFGDERAVANALAEKLWMELDYKAVLSSLRVDLAKEMYWFDPAGGISISLQGGVRTTGSTQDALVLGVQFRFAVSQTFQGSGGTYTTNPEWVLSAESSLAKIDGNTISNNPENTSNSTEPSNGEEGEVAVQVQEGENEIATQNNTNDVWGEVDGIRVEKEFELTDDTITFQGGEINAGTVPTKDTAGYDKILEKTSFYRAYVEINGTRYPISKLGKGTDGQIYYIVANQKADGTEFTYKSKLPENSMIIFSYRITETTNTITYRCVNEDNLNILRDEYVTSLGGFRNQVQVVRRVSTIADGQVVYFQIRRLPGTNLTVSAVNANGSPATVTNVTEQNAAGETEFVNTYRLSGTKGNVTIMYTSNWKKNWFNVSLTMRSVAYTTVAAMNGRLKVDSLYIINTYDSGNDGRYTTNASSSSSPVLAVTGSVNIQSNLYKTRVQFAGVHNTIYQTGNSGWYQILSGISVGGETVKLPTKVGNGAAVTTTLTRGEAYGTDITVTMVGTETVGGHKIPYYNIEVSNVHSDVSIQTQYSPMGTQATYAFTSTTGVDAQIYLNKDWVTPSVTMWQTITAGDYYYGKNARTPSNNAAGYTYTIRWKNKPGYYRSEVNVIHSSGTQRYTTWNDVNAYDKKATYNAKDGYWYATIDLKPTSNSDLVYVGFSAQAIYYTIASYSAAGGKYLSNYVSDKKQDSLQTDGKVYDSVLDNQIIVSKVRPEKEGYVFVGYKIAEDTSGTIYPAGSYVDTSKLSLSDTTTYKAGTSGSVAQLNFVAQWSKIQEGTPGVGYVIIQTMTKSGTYATVKIPVSAVVGGTYEVDIVQATKITQDGDTLTISEDSKKVKLSGIGGTDEELYAKLTYEHPTTVTFSLGDGVDGSTVTGTSPTSSTKLSYVDTIDLSVNTRLTRTGYVHLGWYDAISDTSYYFDGTVTTHSLDDDAGIAVLAEETADESFAVVDTLDDDFAVADTLDDSFAVGTLLDDAFAVAALSDEGIAVQDTEEAVEVDAENPYGIIVYHEDGRVEIPEAGTAESTSQTASSSGGTTMVIADANGLPIYTFDPNTYTGSIELILATHADAVATDRVQIPWNGMNLTAIWREEEITANNIWVTAKDIEGITITDQWLLDNAQAKIVNKTTGATVGTPTINSSNVSKTPGIYSVELTTGKGTGQSNVTKTINVTVYADEIEITTPTMVFTQSEVTEYKNDGTLNNRLIQSMGVKAFVSYDKTQSVPIANVDHQIEAVADEYTVTFYTAYGSKVEGTVVVPPTIPQFTASPTDQLPAFTATLPGETVQEAIEKAGVDIQAALQALPGISVETILRAVGGTSGSVLRSATNNFIIVGPNNSGFVISGASGTGYIFANKDGSYSLPGAGANFVITGSHETGFQVTAPSGEIFDVIGDNDTGFLLVSQDKELFTILGNSVTGFVVVSLQTLADELGLSTTTTDTVQSPLTDGGTKNLYPFGFVGGMLLALLCVMQWNEKNRFGIDIKRHTQ